MFQAKCSTFVKTSLKRNVLLKTFCHLSPHNVLKTFYKCCFDNVPPFLLWNIVPMFYKLSLYNLLSQQNPQNMLEMLHV